MSAIFSPCRTWRYTLTRLTEHAVEGSVAREFGVRPVFDRVLSEAGGRAVAQGRFEHVSTVAFIGLNPSTADETVNDPTVRRCVSFAQSWGFERMVMLNVFAFRATDPKALYGLDYYTACGPHNFDDYIVPQSSIADLVVCAWGVHGALHGRGEIVRDRLRTIIGKERLHVLGLTRDGHPKHPLYLRASLTPQPWGESA